MDKKLKEEITQKYNFTKEELQVIIEAIPANVFFKDREGRYQVASHVCEMISGGTEDFTLVGKTDYEIQPDKELGKRYLEEDLDVVATGKELKYVQEMVFGGESYFYEITKRPVRNFAGEIMGVIGFINDVTEIMKLQKRLLHYTVTDRMTGIYNRTYFEQHTQKIEEDQLPMAVIMADCNNLKYVNDHFGHKQGDYLIISTVTNVSRYLEGKDELMRIGGDEFLILCPNCNERKCEELISKIKEGEKSISINGTSLSSSYGYTIIEKPGMELRDAVVIADQKMYEEKKKIKQIK